MITIPIKALGVECVTDVPLEDIPELMLKHRRSEVIEAYCKVLDCTEEVLLELEGGIDTWIGFGSVTCFELAGGTLVGYGPDEIQMAVIAY